MTNDNDFRHRAACRDEDPELFFPVGNTRPAILQTAQALAVCRGCPVKAACLNWALDTGVEGIYGGTTEAERRAARKAAREQAVADLAAAVAS